MSHKFSTVQDIVDWRLCLGCGVCVSVCKKKYITLENIESRGIRPRVKPGECGTCSDCLKVCPGFGISKKAGENTGITSLQSDWGQVLEIWGGYAVDEELRCYGSSGGAASALALYCLEKEGVGQVAHIARDETGWTNKTVLSRSRSELLERTGSRYAPASPCESSAYIAEAEAPSVFIGKPCDVQGARKGELVRPELQDKICLAISIFCAGTPSTEATIKLLESLKVRTDCVSQIRYRGRGWPGNFTVWTNGSDRPAIEIPYLDAWEFLQKYRPYRCYLCPDGTGEFADISCGDPWYRMDRNNPGYSLILLRTNHGQQIFHRAMESGYIKADRVDPSCLPLSQPGFPDKRGAIWGRLLALKMFGIPTPRYDGWPLFGCWRKLSVQQKVRSIIGTFKRIMQRRYYRRETFRQSPFF